MSTVTSACQSDGKQAMVCVGIEHELSFQASILTAQSLVVRPAPPVFLLSLLPRPFRGRLVGLERTLVCRSMHQSGRATDQAYLQLQCW